MPAPAFRYTRLRQPKIARKRSVPCNIYTRFCKSEEEQRFGIDEPRNKLHKLCVSSPGTLLASQQANELTNALSQAFELTTSKKEKTMKPLRKVLIGRSVILACVLLSATAFAIAIYNDRSSGTLLDKQGIVDREFVDEPMTLPLSEPAG